MGVRGWVGDSRTYSANTRTPSLFFGLNEGMRGPGFLAWFGGIRELLAVFLSEWCRAVGNPGGWGTRRSVARPSRNIEPCSQS
jgi:hypothetical protein